MAFLYSIFKMALLRDYCHLHCELICVIFMHTAMLSGLKEHTYIHKECVYSAKTLLVSATELL